jgi:ABC-type transporter MlaC component
MERVGRPAPLTVSVLIGALFFSTPLQAQSDSASSYFVSRLNVSIQAALSQFSDSAGQAERVCRDLSAWALDLPSMMHTASAGTWDRMSPTQRKAYSAAFRKRLLRDCAAQAAGYLLSSLELSGLRILPNGDRLMATRSTDGPFAPTLMWQARIDSAGVLKVTDLLVHGRSAVLMARDDAQLVLEQHAGDVAALIESLVR